MNAIRRCTGCGKSARQSIGNDLAGRPRERAEVLAAARAVEADLEVTWLVPAAKGYTLARYCCDCAPVGFDVLAVDCGECGADGPIVLLDDAALPGMPVARRDREHALEHLRACGWHIDACAMACPDCATAMEPTGAPQ